MALHSAGTLPTNGPVKRPFDVAMHAFATIEQAGTSGQQAGTSGQQASASGQQADRNSRSDMSVDDRMSVASENGLRAMSDGPL